MYAKGPIAEWYKESKGEDIVGKPWEAEIDCRAIEEKMSADPPDLGMAVCLLLRLSAKQRLEVCLFAFFCQTKYMNFRVLSTGGNQAQGVVQPKDLHQHLSVG